MFGRKGSAELGMALAWSGGNRRPCREKDSHGECLGGGGRHGNEAVHFVVEGTYDPYGGLFDCFAQIRRFVRFNLGEGIQKKSVDFAAEVAAQTAAKTDAKPAAEAPKVEEAKKEDEAPKVRLASKNLLFDSL